MACLTPQQIESLVRMTADSAEAAECRRHIDQCSTCRQRLEEWPASERPPKDAKKQPTEQETNVAGSLGVPDTLGTSVTVESPGPGGATPAPLLPDSVPGYQIVREIHRGGQGVVYYAIQKSTKRGVALKVMKEGPFASRAERARFEREVEILGQLNHPNIVTIHDSGEAAGHFYFVMDYISGQPLDMWLTSRPRSMEEALRLFAKICDAVNAAHLKGVIHRDLKPGNIRIDDADEPHILDFGLAKVTQGTAEASLMTQTGQFMGSLPWASPEQAEARPGKIDLRTDVYSLGVILYQLLTGEFPYDVTGNLRDVLDRIVRVEPRRPSLLRKQISHDVETIVIKCLSKERERRYACAGAIADDIRRYLAGAPIQARRDSLMYVAWARMRQAQRRHPVGALLGGLVLIALLTQYLAVPVVYRWTPLNYYYEAALTALPTARAVPDWQHVRVIALTDKTDIAGLARAAGLPDVAVENRPSLRRLHGALMERLAAAGLRVLVWDIRFAAPSDFDAGLVRGIEAVRARGTDVIVSVGDWRLGETGLPALSPAVLPYVKWGATTADFSGERPWSLDLFVERLGREPRASLALLAVAAYRRPGAEVILLVNPSLQSVSLRYWEPVPDAPRAKHWLEGGESLRLTGLWVLPDDEDDFGLRRDDVIGHYFVAIPPDDVLERGTLEYQDVFAAEGPQLRSWLANRVVIVADLRPDIDRHPYRDGRSVAGVYGHAAAIEALLRSVAIRTPTMLHTWTIIGFAVLAGGVLELRLHRSVTRSTLLLVVLAALITVASEEAFRRFQYLVNPLVPVFALVASGVFVAFVCRQAWAAREDTKTWEVTQ